MHSVQIIIDNSFIPWGYIDIFFSVLLMLLDWASLSLNTKNKFQQPWWHVRPNDWLIDWLIDLPVCSLLIGLRSPPHWSANLVFQCCFNYAIVQEQLAAAFNQIHNQHVLSQRQLLKVSKLPRTHLHIPTLLNTHLFHSGLLLCN